MALRPSSDFQSAASTGLRHAPKWSPRPDLRRLPSGCNGVTICFVFGDVKESRQRDLRSPSPVYRTGASLSMLWRRERNSPAWSCTKALPFMRWLLYFLASGPKGCPSRICTETYEVKARACCLHQRAEMADRVGDAPNTLRYRRFSKARSGLPDFTIQEKWSKRGWLQSQTRPFEDRCSLLAYASMVLPVGPAPTLNRV